MLSAWRARSCVLASGSRLTWLNGNGISGKIDTSQHSCDRLGPLLLSHRLYSSTPTTADGSNPAPRVAIVGSGPAGFYTARKLMREINGTKIDMYEQLPVPFGLVRFGVAPDHPEVKNCQDEFEQVASSPNYTFIGNVQLGKDLPLPILSKHYDAIVFSYGASKDKELGLQGEDKPHIYSARAFVGWYNGLPEYRNLDPDLRAGETAIVIGQGNVALDVARILLSPISNLQRTDLTSYAISRLSESTIKHVHVVGRRGPAQAAFTIKEVRELINLPSVNFKPIDEALFPPDLSTLPRPRRRLLELLKKGKPEDPSAPKSCSLDFLLAPAQLNWSENDGSALTGVTFTQTKLENPRDQYSKVHDTGSRITLPTSTLFRSIGYRAEALPGIDLLGAAFNHRWGTLEHDGVGRIMPLDTTMSERQTAASVGNTPVQTQAPAAAKASLYCAGWVKRGPTGVIASTMTDAFETAEAIVADWKEALSTRGSGRSEQKLGWEGVKAEAESEGHRLEKIVNWEGWHRIDEAERKAGERQGKPREKFGSVREMIAAARVSQV